MMMDFEEFKGKAVESIRDYLPAGFARADITIQNVVKNNDTVLSGLLIRKDDVNIAPTIYLEDFYKDYTDGKGFGDIMKDIARMRMAHDVTKDVDTSMFQDLEKVKGKIFPKLINAEMNKEYLSDKPHTIKEDLAVVYAIDLGERGDGRISTMINNQMMEYYNLSTDELHDIALDNLSKMDIQFRTMRDVLIDMMFPDGMREDDPMVAMLPPEEEKPSMYVLTANNMLNGAMALLDQKTMDDISQKLGGDFIVLPSSVHESILLPVNGAYDEHSLESLVRDVNASIVAPEERLSDHVYIYDSVEKELVLADKMAERLQRREEARKDAKTTDRSEKKPERERVSMKKKLAEKKAEVAKNAECRDLIPAKKMEMALG